MDVKLMLNGFSPFTYMSQRDKYSTLTEWIQKSRKFINSYNIRYDDSIDTFLLNFLRWHFVGIVVYVGLGCLFVAIRLPVLFAFGQILFCVEVSEQHNERYHVSDEGVVHPERKLTTGANTVDAHRHSRGELNLWEEKRKHELIWPNMNI